ncbi:MAG: substrate-binding domain-containing protein [Phycisphaerae bacterium]|nr:substrate-binding domain-containing protein [Phycisphaerae bacterium]
MTAIRRTHIGHLIVASLALSLALLLAGVGCDNKSSSTPAPDSKSKTDSKMIKGGNTIEGSATRPAANGNDLTHRGMSASGQTCTRASKVDGPLKIAVVPKGTTHEFWKAIHAGAVKAELELNDVEIIWKGPLRESDRTDQINVLENFITAKFNGIAVAPLDNVALARPIQEATKAGISVVVMDSAVNAAECQDYASFVATDNYVGGTKAAEHLGKILGGKGNLLVMRYAVGSASTAEREQGFLDTMKAKFPDIVIVSSDQYGGDTTESSFNKAETLLNKFKNIQGIFTPNESTTFGMLRAVEQAKLGGDVKFVGFDSSEKLIQALADGHIHGLIVQNPMAIGYQSVKNLVAYLRGEPVPAKIDTGSVLATPENMKQPEIADILRPPVDTYLRDK